MHPSSLNYPECSIKKQSVSKQQDNSSNKLWKEKKFPVEYVYMCPFVLNEDLLLDWKENQCFTSVAKKIFC
jgi:hypothetical protein